MAEHDPQPPCSSSEFSWGEGMHPNPEVSYDRDLRSGFPNNRPPGYGNRDEQVRDLQASMRTNTATPGDTLDEMYYAAGNTDRYGAQPPLVRTPPTVLPPDPDLDPVVVFERKE